MKEQSIYARNTHNKTQGKHDEHTLQSYTTW